MIQIKVTKDGIVTNIGTFETQDQASAWLASQDFGDAVITTEDITAQIEREKAIAEAITYLQQTDYMVVRVAEGYTLADDVKIKREAARVVIRS